MSAPGRDVRAQPGHAGERETLATRLGHGDDSDLLAARAQEVRTGQRHQQAVRADGPPEVTGGGCGERTAPGAGDPADVGVQIVQCRPSAACSRRTVTPAGTVTAPTGSVCAHTMRSHGTSRSKAAPSSGRKRLAAVTQEWASGASDSGVTARGSPLRRTWPALPTATTCGSRAPSAQQRPVPVARRARPAPAGRGYRAGTSAASGGQPSGRTRAVRSSRAGAFAVVGALLAAGLSLAASLGHGSAFLLCRRVQARVRRCGRRACRRA